MEEPSHDQLKETASKTQVSGALGGEEHKPAATQKRTKADVVEVWDEVQGDRHAPVLNASHGMKPDDFSKKVYTLPDHTLITELGLAVGAVALQVDMPPPSGNGSHPSIEGAG